MEAEIRSSSYCIGQARNRTLCPYWTPSSRKELEIETETTGGMMPVRDVLVLDQKVLSGGGGARL